MAYVDNEAQTSSDKFRRAHALIVDHFNLNPRDEDAPKTFNWQIWDLKDFNIRISIIHIKTNKCKTAPLPVSGQRQYTFAHLWSRRSKILYEWPRIDEVHEINAVIWAKWIITKMQGKNYNRKSYEIWL